MMHFSLTTINSLLLKQTKRTTEAEAKGVACRGFTRVHAPTTVPARVRAIQAGHKVLLSRVQTSQNVSKMTRYDNTMSEAEIVAKFMGISVEEAALL